MPESASASLRIEPSGAADGIITLRLDGRHGNAIGPSFVAELIAACDRLDADASVRGVLLASAHPRIFCPGLDLLELYPLDRPALEVFLRAFCRSVLRLFELQKPVVAAVAGHAVAGGCVLALAADHRVLAAEGATIGLNEIRIGLGLPWGVATLLRHAVDPSKLAQVAMLGHNLAGREAIAAGLVQELAPVGQVETRARERLVEYAAKSPAAIRLIKRYLRREAAESMRTGDEALTGEFLDVWFSPAARETLGATVASLREKEGSRGSPA